VRVVADLRVRRAGAETGRVMRAGWMQVELRVGQARDEKFFMQVTEG